MLGLPAIFENNVHSGVFFLISFYVHFFHECICVCSVIGSASTQLIFEFLNFVVGCMKMV